MKLKKINIIGYSGHSFGCIEVLINQWFSIIGYDDVFEKVINLEILNSDFHNHRKCKLIKN